jgi:hypothetical protein
MNRAAREAYIRHRIETINLTGRAWTRFAGLAGLFAMVSFGASCATAVVLGHLVSWLWQPLPSSWLQAFFVFASCWATASLLVVFMWREITAMRTAFVDFVLALCQNHAYFRTRPRFVNW